MYTVEWIENKLTEVSITYEKYEEAMDVYEELLQLEDVTNVVLTVKNKGKLPKIPRNKEK